MHLLTLIGVLVVIVGFALKVNPLLVVTVAGIATGFAGGLHPVEIISEFGRAFTENRYMGLVWLTLPVIGLLERGGLKERAQELISRIHSATTGRVLLLYLAIRQLTATIGLTSLGGQAQMVRPLIAPMAEAAAEARFGNLPNQTRYLIRAHAAAVDNVGVFFGEDIFLAMGSVLLIKGVLDANGIHLTPLHIALWAIPTAVAVFIIHSVRLMLLDRRLRRQFKTISNSPLPLGGEGSSQSGERAAKDGSPGLTGEAGLRSLEKGEGVSNGNEARAASKQPSTESSE